MAGHEDWVHSSLVEATSRHLDHHSVPPTYAQACITTTTAFGLCSTKQMHVRVRVAAAPRSRPRPLGGPHQSDTAETPHQHGDDEDDVLDCCLPRIRCHTSHSEHHHGPPGQHHSCRTAALSLYLNGDCPSHPCATRLHGRDGRWSCAGPRGVARAIGVGLRRRQAWTTDGTRS